MLLRPRQKELVARSVAALHKHGNTLAVAPTGAGKTIMLSAIIGEMFKSSSSKACVLAHRDELTFQNEDKFRRVNPALGTGVFDASVKSWRGDVTFAMVQTLSREPYTAAQIDKALVLAGVEPEQKSLQQSRTVKGGQTATAATVGVGALEAVRESLDPAREALLGIVQYVDAVKWLLLFVTLVGIGIMVWARIDDRRKGLR